MQRTGRIVGRAVASLCNLLDLDLVVVGGGVALGFAATFFNAAHEELDTLARLPYSRHARITPTPPRRPGSAHRRRRRGIRGMRAGCARPRVRSRRARRPARGDLSRRRRDEDPQPRLEPHRRTAAGRAAAAAMGFPFPGGGGGGLRHPDEGGRRHPRHHRRCWRRCSCRSCSAAVDQTRLVADAGAGPCRRRARRRRATTELEQIAVRRHRRRPGVLDARRSRSSSGADYEPTETVFFSGATNTGCGQATSQIGPFYCPVDELVYFDLEFLAAAAGAARRRRRPRRPVHRRPRVRTPRAERARHQRRGAAGPQQQDPSQANEYSVALELQADCLAGVWAHDADERGQLEQGEIDEALNAAEAVGDDRIQEQTQGRIDPESWTHGIGRAACDVVPPRLRDRRPERVQHVRRAVSAPGGAARRAPGRRRRYCRPRCVWRSRPGAGTPRA